MALLTADDIRYRKFAPTRFREGYDVDEVDDFLEEVIHTVEELTRLAQNSAANTGSFQALKPLVTDPESSPVFLDLKRENDTLISERDALNAKVKELEEKLANIPADGIAPVVSDAGVAEKEKQLIDDNRELAQHLQNAEIEITDLKKKLEDAKSEANLGQGVAGSPEDSEKIASLNSELSTLRHDFEVAIQTKERLEQQVNELREDSESDDANRLQAELSEVRDELKRANETSDKLRSELASAKNSSNTSGETLTAGGPNEASAMLSMAQQLHDEYIEKGKNEANKILEDANGKKEKLVESGKLEHDRLINEGTKEREKLVTEAKAKADETYAKLAQERKSIEDKIEELRRFEGDYRKKLTKFLKGMLDEVDANAAVFNENS
jgi:DivIVA domain-containing protein